MRVGGGLVYVEGPMGAGKSLFGTRKIVGALLDGKPVVTNVRLGIWRGGEFYPGDGWAEYLARRVVAGSTVRRGKWQRVALSLLDRYRFETDLNEAMRYRVPGRGEARALFVWDETHNDLNNRNWRERMKANATERGTDRMLEWATQLRKLGFLGFLLSQHADNTDAALRRVCSFRVRLQNQKEQTRLLGMPITPWPLFLAAWLPTHLAIGQRGQAAQPIRVERYFLSYHRKLYDTHDLYHGLAGEEDQEANVVWLPAPVGARHPAKRGRAPGHPTGPAAVLPPVDHPPMQLLDAKRRPLATDAASETDHEIPARGVLRPS